MVYNGMEGFQGAAAGYRLPREPLVATCLPASVCPCVQYDEKLCGLLENYDKCFIVHADNVGSKQFMDIRRVRPLTSACWSLQALLVCY